MEKIIVAALALYAVYEFVRATSPSQTPAPAPGQDPTEQYSPVARIRWDEPVASTGEGIRAVGDASGVHLEVTGLPPGGRWGLRNRHRANRRLYGEVKDLVIPSNGIVKLDDQTPLPAVYIPGSYDVEFLWRPEGVAEYRVLVLPGFHVRAVAEPGTSAVDLAETLRPEHAAGFDEAIVADQIRREREFWTDGIAR